MKRPEGFDAAPPKSVAPAAARPPRAATQQAAARQAQPKQAAPQQAAPKQAALKRAALKQAAPKQAKPSRATPDAAREVRRAAAERRKYERQEVRRFTRRSRRRRITVGVVIGCVVLLVGLSIAAIYSPLLSLRTITVAGTSRVDPKQIEQAVRGQLGTPLALVDFSAIREDLAKFPMIRSYVTESVPPDTLVIRVTERAPVAAVQTAAGYSVVDPAGVVLDNPTTKPAGLPLLSGKAALTSSAAFDASVRVLLALPSTLSATIDTITAQTNDDVAFTLAGGQQVVWGSGDDSSLKARVLADLIKNEPAGAKLTYNVSAPNSPVIATG